MRKSLDTFTRFRAVCHIILYAIFVFATFFALFSCTKQDTTSSPTRAAMTRPVTNPDTKPMVAIVEWPMDPLGKKLFWVSDNLNAFHTMGFQDPWEKLNGFPFQWGSADKNDICQFRLSNGTQALAVPDNTIFTSIVLIYSVNPDQAVGKSAITGTTGEGSVEAWLLRHPVPAFMDSQPYDPATWQSYWEKFLQATDRERDQWPNAFRLQGTIKLIYDAGFVKDAEVDLHSETPLPIFEKFIDYEEATEKRSLVFVAAWEKYTPERLAEMEQNISIKYDALRTHPTKQSAQITGWVRSGWTQPLFNFVWP